MSVLSSKLEAAAKSVVDDLALSGVASLTGSDDDTKTIPCVMCIASDGNELHPGLGNYEMPLRIEVHSNASDDGLTTHKTRASTVIDAFNDDEIAATLSAAEDDFYVFGVNGRVQGTDNTEQQFVDYIELVVYCCESDMT